MKEPTKEDLDRVHKLILEIEKKRLLDDEIIDDCIELLNHFSIFHHLFGLCNPAICEQIELFWRMEQKLDEILSNN